MIDIKCLCGKKVNLTNKQIVAYGKAMFEMGMEKGYNEGKESVLKHNIILLKLQLKTHNQFKEKHETQH